MSLCLDVVHGQMRKRGELLIRLVQMRLIHCKEHIGTLKTMLLLYLKGDRGITLWNRGLGAWAVHGNKGWRNGNVFWVQRPLGTKLKNTVFWLMVFDGSVHCSTLLLWVYGEVIHPCLALETSLLWVSEN